MKKQPGFTLIELAIVLVIIGLLLGGILKGQELINSAKVKNMANDFTSIAAIVYGYQDKFRAMPGDDPAAVAHTGGTLATSGGTAGNGLIEGAWSSTTSTDEAVLFWQHVRLAGLAQGPSSIADASYYPKNADGGRLGVQSVSGFATITGMGGAFVVCSDGIQGKYAKQLDTALDDGETSTGALRAVVSGTPGAGITTALLANAANCTVCMSF
ncbi:MAG: prepilin-type N-terminal cleavage/methylation domain-containing protein [Nitrosomonadales bacterium]|nr:MAG: prepilin-type N-terminal cleavage/methylation domain-containing protein [Nitrosomonadales bacterium]